MERINGKENFELVTMRHRQFKRTTMPDTATLRKWEPQIARAARKALWQYKPVWGGASFDLDDLMSYGRVWACMYLDQMQIPDEEGNKRLFLYHLSQRFGELAKATNHKMGATYLPVVRSGDPEVDLLQFVADERPNPEQVLIPEETVEVEMTPIANPRSLLRKRLASLSSDERKARLSSLLDDSDREIVEAAQKYLSAEDTGGKLGADTPEIAEKVRAMVDACLAALPDSIHCPHCKRDRPKTAFGIRVPRVSKTDRTPTKAMRQARCNECR